MTPASPTIIQKPDMTGFVNPDAADWTTVSMLHRKHDKFVPIYVTRSDVAPLVALPGWNITDMGHGLTTNSATADLIDADAYFAINAFWTDSTWRNESDVVISGQSLNKPKRRKSHCHYLNAVWLDLDCYNRGITPGQAIGALIDSQDAGQIPPVSVYHRSGRGVWAFWLIRDPRPEHAHKGCRANRKAVPMAQAVLRELQRRFNYLGADVQSADVCRITRIPGTVNSKADQRVSYLIGTDASGKVPDYTLDDFVELFGLDCEYKPQVRTGGLLRGGLDPVKTARLRWEKEAERMTLLIQSRGVIREGHRGAAVWLYSLFLRRCGLSGTDYSDPLERLWDRLERTDGVRDARHGNGGQTSREFTRKEFNRIVKGETAANPRHEQIADQLGITAAESQLTGWPAAGEQRDLTRPEKQAMRRALIQELWAGNSLPSLRMMAAMISQRDSRLKCSFRTVKNDVDFILCKNNANKG